MGPKLGGSNGDAQQEPHVPGNDEIPKGRDISSLVVLGKIVHLEQRNLDNGPIIGQGKISKINNDGTFELTADGGEVLNFNRHGLSMPYQRQLQVRIPNSEEAAARFDLSPTRAATPEQEIEVLQLPEEVRSYSGLPNAIFISGASIGDSDDVDMIIYTTDSENVYVSRVKKYLPGNKIEEYGGPTKTGTDYSRYGMNAPSDTSNTNKMLSGADAILGTALMYDADDKSVEVFGESKAKLIELIKLAHKK